MAQGCGGHCGDKSVVTQHGVQMLQHLYGAFWLLATLAARLWHQKSLVNCSFRLRDMIARGKPKKSPKIIAISLLMLQEPEHISSIMRTFQRQTGKARQKVPTMSNLHSSIILIKSLVAISRKSLSEEW